MQTICYENFHWNLLFPFPSITTLQQFFPPPPPSSILRDCLLFLPKLLYLTSPNPVESRNIFNEHLKNTYLKFTFAGLEIIHEGNSQQISIPLSYRTEFIWSYIDYLSHLSLVITSLHCHWGFY